MKDKLTYYSVGPLLYCPANNAGLADSLAGGLFGAGYSLALCLEDTIREDLVHEAEETLAATLKALVTEKEKRDFYLPKIYIRVREPRQIPAMLEMSGSAGTLIHGFVLPKFDEGNADEYLKQIVDAEKTYGREIYAMPILESSSLIPLHDRYRVLDSLRKKLDDTGRLILNVRVGGNDLCHAFGFRRHSDESIYDIRPVADILSDIVTVFGTDYVVSGPVWEYYSGSRWEEGLRRELRQDRLCGFIGKTVIHPKQIPGVIDAYKVTCRDFEDAKAILDWDPSSRTLVSGNTAKERMNELKTHSNWAFRILMLSEAFGVKNTSD